MTAPKITWTAGLGLALAAAAAPALAQDPPARVGRIAYVAGPVSFSPAGAADWAQAPLNRPLVAGDRLWTDAGARDEAQFGSAIARMDAGTLLTVLAADDRTTQLQVSQGRVDVHVRRLAPGETVEVDTPNLAFVARQPGDYRLAVAPDGGTTDVTVLRGAGEAYGDGSSLALVPGQGYRFGGQDLNNYALLQPVPPDDFDRWAMGRDQRYERAVARRYVPQGVVGAEDLDDYGSWRQVPDYGTVWVPDRAPQGWAPYHAGHWAWIDPWGWTWIDDQPYGYAVSHYGRWVRTPDTWAWVPAPVQARPVYAPALVAFVGAVLAVGGRSDPGVGWFPLAPHEPYRPPYRASPTYITNVNVTNTVIRQTNIVNNVTNIRYVNRTVPGAIVAMPAQQFAQAVPTARAGLLLPPGVARAAPVLAAPQARPLPQSRVGAPLAGRLPPAPVQQRVAVTRALPRAAFGSGAALAGAAAAHAAAPGRHGAPLAVHGPVPPLRVLRPAIGKPVIPQPARGPVPGVDAAGRQFAQAGRPGMPPGSGPAASHGPHGLVALPPGAQPGQGARAAQPVAGAPLAAGAGPVSVPGAHGRQLATDMPPAGPGAASAAGPHGLRPGGGLPLAAVHGPAGAPGAHGPQGGASAPPVGGPGVVAVPVPRGPQAAGGMSPAAAPHGPGMPVQAGGPARGAAAAVGMTGGRPDVRPGHPGGAPVPGRPGMASGAPAHGPRAAAMAAAPANVASAPAAAHPPERVVQGREAQGPQAAHGVPPRGAERYPRAAAAPAPHPQAAPHAPPPASHETSRAPAPQRIAMQAPHPQAALHAPPAAPREPPRPAPQPPREPPHPAPQPPHEPPHPAPQPPHPAPQPPHPQPAPAHGGEKGGEHGHKHGEQGGH
jgi:hypothetical protein